MHIPLYIPAISISYGFCKKKLPELYLLRTTQICSLRLLEEVQNESYGANIKVEPWLVLSGGSSGQSALYLFQILEAAGISGESLFIPPHRLCQP